MRATAVRTNGLTAPSYTPVADLDPVLATALLADLRQRGVAAYTKPIESTTTSGFDRPEFRVGVQDRLYVDAAASVRVRELLSDRDPALLADNDDLTWAQIVAGFDQPLPAGFSPWPSQEDLATEPVDRDEATAGPLRGGGGSDVVLPFTDRRRKTDPRQPDEASDEPETAPSTGTPGQPQGPRTPPFDDVEFLASTSRSARADDEDHFVPEPPPPLPLLPPYKQVAWLGVAGGPVLLLLAALFGIVLPEWVAFLGVIGFIGGFVTLVATMSERDDGGWGPDDGAVV